jgi:hypothetical protein
MSIEIMAQKASKNTLIVASLADEEKLESLNYGEPCKVLIKKASSRSIQHHKLYFGGLVRLVSDYWDAEQGLIPKGDKKIMSGLVQFVASQGVDTMAISTLINAYLSDRAGRIKSKISQVEKAANRLDQIHKWLKEEAGYYDAVLTPTGVRKELHSISFNKMSQEEFNEFYKKVFAVAWRYIFSQNNFKTEQEAEEAVQKMSQMG